MGILAAKIKHFGVIFLYSGYKVLYFLIGYCGGIGTYFLLFLIDEIE